MLLTNWGLKGHRGTKTEIFRFNFIIVFIFRGVYDES